MQLSIPRAWQPATQQLVYRALLDAMARPGTLADLAALAGGQLRAGVIALAALLDHTVSLCDLEEALSPQTRRFLEAAPAPQDEAGYLLAAAARPPDPGLSPRLGTLASPDQGATLVLDGASVGRGPLVLALGGPGIPGERRLALGGFDPAWLARREEWVAGFPLGVDLILADAGRIACLPRTTRVRVLRREGRGGPGAR